MTDNYGLHWQKTDKIETRPLVREDTLQRQDSNFENKISGQKSQIGFDTKCCTRSTWTIINVGGVSHIDTSPHNGIVNLSS
jgi:hypothetical protein